MDQRLAFIAEWLREEWTMTELAARYQFSRKTGALRTDKGSPFARTGAGRLSHLVVWWLKLGIQLERIDPGHPEQNGRHERFHLTLQQETTAPPAPTPRAQQRRFDRMREEFNAVRPHEALGQRPRSVSISRSPGPIRRGSRIRGMTQRTKCAV